MNRRSFLSKIVTAAVVLPQVGSSCNRKPEPEIGSFRGFLHVVDENPRKFNAIDYKGEFRWINVQEVLQQECRKVWTDRHREAYRLAASTTPKVKT